MKLPFSNPLHQLPKSAVSLATKVKNQLSRWNRNFLLFNAILTIITIPALFAIPPLTEPLPWLPAAGEADALLANLLTAQATITALSLAVTLFVMQGVANRMDTDARVYHEYIRRSRVRYIFWGSIQAVLVTATVLLSEKFVSRTEHLVELTPGLPNLTLVAACALVSNLGLVAVLFERAVRITDPERWRSIRTFVNKRDVRDAVQAFIHRYRTAAANMQSGNIDVTVAFPGAKEGSANEAVVALLDDGRRAMGVRRLREFRNSMGEIRELLVFGMDEITRHGLEFGPPGSQPQWPPLRELGSNLYCLREEVIQGNSRDYLFEILGLDHWNLRTGMRRNCGELFTQGLAGYRWNYRIATHAGVTEMREMLRDRLYPNASPLFFDQEPQKVKDYLSEMIRHQARMLSDALDAGNQQDFQRLHEEFGTFVKNISAEWGSRYPANAGAVELHKELLQEYRISLMGLEMRMKSLG